MNQFKVITRGRSTALVAALLVALCLGLIGTTDASAAPAYRDCAALAEGSAQTSASRTNGDATTSFSTADETGQPGTQVIIVEGCAGGIAQSSNAVSSGSTCAFTLPQGVAPGSTIIVNQSSESPGCAMQIVEPGTSTFQVEPANVVGGASGGELCATELPGNVTITLEPQGESGGTANSDGGSFSVATIPGVEAGTIEIVPANGAGTGVITCGFGTANAGGATSEGTFTVDPATDGAGCGVVIEGSAGGAQTGGKATAAPDDVAPGEAGASDECTREASGSSLQPDAEASAGGNPTWTCTMGSDPNVAPVCTREP